MGFIFNDTGIQPDQIKTDAIRFMPFPYDITILGSFLGATKYYGKSVNNIRQPLDELLKKNSAFEWTPGVKKSFEEFKNNLQSYLLLTHPNPEHEIVVAADASNSDVAPYIFHSFKNGSIKTLQHSSRIWTEATKIQSNGRCY